MMADDPFSAMLFQLGTALLEKRRQRVSASWTFIFVFVIIMLVVLWIMGLIYPVAALTQLPGLALQLLSLLRKNLFTYRPCTGVA